MAMVKEFKIAKLSIDNIIVQIINDTGVLLIYTSRVLACQHTNGERKACLYL